MIYDWTTEIDIKQDNVLEIPVPENIEGEIVQGDRLRVRVIVEEVLVDGEEEALLEMVREAKAEWEADGCVTIPWEDIKAEWKAEEELEALRRTESETAAPIREKRAA